MTAQQGQVRAGRPEVIRVCLDPAACLRVNLVIVARAICLLRFQLWPE